MIRIKLIIFFLLFCNWISIYADYFIEQWKIFEVEFYASKEGNPYIETHLSATFTNGGVSTTIKGFYDGNGKYVISFSPSSTGEWKYITNSNVSELNQIKGNFNCVKASGSNKGPVIIKNTFSFEYSNGTPNNPFGTTLYAWTHQNDSLKKLTLKTLGKNCFNKVRMCVFPKAYWWNQTEPEEYPFLLTFEGIQDFTRINPSFFQKLENHIKQLDELGIETDIILFHPYDRWGYNKMSKETNLKYLEYIISRFSAFKNVWWSLANEYDFINNFSLAYWNELIDFIDKEDPYSRLKSIHNGVVLFDYSNPKISHASIQTTDLSMINFWRNKFQKPIIIDEYGYEGNIPWDWGNFSPEAIVSSFWTGISNGAFVTHRETYLSELNSTVRLEDSNDILWRSKGGILRGDSPKRIAFLMDIIEKGSGNKEDNKDNYIIYFGVHQPALHLLQLESDINFEVSIIDTWNMTIEVLNNKFSGYSLIELPSRPYLALRIKKIK